MIEPNKDNERLQRILQSHADQLGEHFQNVHIFVNSMNEGGYTFCVDSCGTGNYLSRYGQIKEWVIDREAYIAAEGRRKLMEDRGGNLEEGE